MKQTDPIRALTAALLGLASLSAPSAADALTELGGAHFSPSAPLVPGVEALLPGAGDIGAYSADLWHVVYVKDEVVFLLMEDGAGGWSDPEPVTTEEAVSPANAQIGAASGFVHVAGRRVRTLVVDAPATSGGLEWDLRDDGGRGVPSGLYWVRVVSGGSVAKRAVSVVR